MLDSFGYFSFMTESLVLLSCLWDGAYKRSLAADQKKVTQFLLSRYLSGPLPQVQHHRTLYKLSYFSFQPVLHNWCNKGCGMCYPVCGMMHIKEPLLLIRKSSPCGGSRFPLSLSEWSFTICLTPYNHK